MLSIPNLQEFELHFKVCSRCIYDERVPSIEFDDAGVCNYCHQIDSLAEQYGTAQRDGEASFAKIIERIKRDGRGKKYDCVIGVSGGTDSSYMIHAAVNDWGLRPLAVHYDNTWNTAISTQNIAKVLGKLDIDLYTHVVSNEEADDLIKSFFEASVAEIEAPTDLALAEVLYRAAWKNNVSYVLEGHSFITEGVTPLGNNYFDGGYIADVHSKFGEVPLKTYPLMTFSRFLFWVTAARIKKIRPFWYLNYSKEEAQNLLKSQYDWRYYGGHHLENRITAFYHSIYMPEKFGADLRNNTLSAKVRNGDMERFDAWQEYSTPPYVEPDLLTYFQQRLGYSETEYQEHMNKELKSWTQFYSYKKRFERMRPLFYLLQKNQLVPSSFYRKYCF